jgi:hypothetical protein
MRGDSKALGARPSTRAALFCEDRLCPILQSTVSARHSREFMRGEGARLSEQRDGFIRIKTRVPHQHIQHQSSAMHARRTVHDEATAGREQIDKMRQPRQRDRVVGVRQPTP